MKNAFGEPIPDIKALLEDAQVRAYIENTLREVLAYLEISNIDELIALTLEKAKTYTSLDAYERDVHLMFDKRRIIQRIPEKLSERADTIYQQIRPYLKGHDILDLGAGDGKVGALIAKQNGRHVVLADVYEHGNITNTQLPFVKLKKGSALPFADESFTTVLLLTVLHHCDDPITLLKEARRVTKKGGRIIILESVFGAQAYGRLTQEQQRNVNIFFDHFYNRIIHYSAFAENKVNVPFNFKTAVGWNALFTILGMRTETTLELGFDQKCVPEYHTLHVVEVPA